MDADYRAGVDVLREQARHLYAAMVDHVTQEAQRTGAGLEIIAPGTVLPKDAVEAPLALRMDVTESTALYARQPHITEASGDKHRSWRITLAPTMELPERVRNGLSRMVEQVATLQGRTWERAQQALALD